MHIDLFEKTAKLEEVLLATHSLRPKIFIIPKHFDVLHATAGSFPLLESRKNKLKQTEKNDSKDSQTD